jgi:succinate dehydrogenase / fumarate reductase, flavoprotein subunit
MKRPDITDTQVLIIGAGAAGLRVAIELAQRGVDCLVLGKRRHGDAHTRWAAGGINAALGNLDGDDRPELHAADTIREGHHICQPRAVDLLVRAAPLRVQELQQWGCQFNVTDDGRIDQRYFGAQSFRRTCFVGDRTGEAILEVLVERARALRVAYRENVFVTRILCHDGRAAGAVGFDMATGAPLFFRAAATVLAAGGCTSLYDRSSSRPDENTGDAMALAFHAGATLRDMEFVQFHPTGMVRPPGMRGRLVTEAVRGEGGRLFNAAGERFMERYAPERMELEARDVVARAIYREIRQGRGTAAGGVLLDISHREPDFIHERLPKIQAQFREHGVAIATDPMEVAPTAHYAMGGVRVDFDTGATDVTALFAVGECTSGVHGANRLGGNSLAETLVFGQITGEYLARQYAAVALPDIPSAVLRNGSADPDVAARSPDVPEARDMATELTRLMWEHAGIVRSEDELRAGLDALAQLRRQADHLSGDGVTDLEWATNLQFMMRTAEMIMTAALTRAESRGAHYREDAPESDPDWRKNVLFACAPNGGLRRWTEEVPPLPASIQAALDEERELDYHHLE